MSEYSPIPIGGDIVTKYYIWSHRRDQWWRPNEEGYTDSLGNAGEYSWEATADIVLSSLPGADIAVPVEMGKHRLSGSTAEVKLELDTLRRL